MTIDINEARKLADENERWCMDESARTIRALCDRVEEARKLIQALAWQKHPTLEGIFECPACGNLRTQKELAATDLAEIQTALHYPTCKLAAWLRGGKA